MAFACLVFALAASALAQYPTRQVRLIVMTPPGGSPDLAARILGESLSSGLRRPIVIENRPGSNGNIAGELVARAVPDGHTLLFASESLIAINPHLYQNMSFSTLKHLAPVASVASNQFLLAVHPSLPASSLAEFVEHARRAHPPLTYAAGGSQQLIGMEWLKLLAGVDLLHVPYRGGAFATNAAVAGEVSVVFAGTSAAPFVRSDKLRALAVSGRDRSRAFPDLPTIGATYPGYEMSAWLGLFAPARTLQAVITRLRAETNKALARPDFQERLAAAGTLEPFSTSLSEFVATIQRDHALYGKLVKSIGIRPD